MTQLTHTATVTDKVLTVDSKKGHMTQKETSLMCQVSVTKKPDSISASTDTLKAEFV